MIVGSTMGGKSKCKEMLKRSYCMLNVNLKKLNDKGINTHADF